MTLNVWSCRSKDALLKDCGFYFCTLVCFDDAFNHVGFYHKGNPRGNTAPDSYEWALGFAYCCFCENTDLVSLMFEWLRYCRSVTVRHCSGQPMCHYDIALLDRRARGNWAWGFSLNTLVSCYKLLYLHCYSKCHVPVPLYLLIIAILGRALWSIGVQLTLGRSSASITYRSLTNTSPF